MAESPPPPPAEADHEAEVAGMLRTMLENQGVLGRMKAQIRACVYKSLDEGSSQKPPLASETLLINELIREYLEYNGYRHTAETLLLESGQPDEKIPRSVIAKQVKIPDMQPDLPLLYSAVDTNKLVG